MTHDETDRIILSYVETAPRTLKPLFATVNRSTAYARISKLIEAGFLVRRGKVLSLTPLGRQALDTARAPSVPAPAEPDLAEHVPHVALAPTPLHRAVATLIAAAVVARKHRLSGSHHATFVLVGEKLCWKTFIARLSCHMVGIDPTRHVLNMAAETPGSLIQRRGGTGKVVTRRLAISNPVVCLDELGRATTEVLRIAQFLFSGEVETAFENDVLEILAVPIATMNPRASGDGAGIAEVVGLDEGTVRRSIIGYFKGGVIPSGVVTEGDARLDRARGMGPAEFPPPRHPGWVPSTEVQRVLREALDRPERLADVDFTMVAQLCTALTAWYPPAVALRLGLRCYLQTLESLGWVKPDWVPFLPPVELSGGRQADSPASAATETSLVRPDPLDHTEKVDFIAATIKRLGIPVEDGVDLMAKLAEVGLARLARLDALDAALSAERIDSEELQAVLSLAREFATTCGKPVAEAPGLICELVRTILGVFPEGLTEAEQLGALRALAARAADSARLKETVRELTGKSQTLQAGCEQARARLREEEVRIADAQARRRQAEIEMKEAERQLAVRKEELQRLDARCAARASDIQRAKDHTLLLSCRLNLDGPFVRELARAFRERRAGRSKSRTANLSIAAIREVFEVYVQCVHPHLVPQWKLKMFIRIAGGEQALKLRKELEKTRDCLRDRAKSEREKLRAIEDAIWLLGIREHIPAP